MPDPVTRSRLIAFYLPQFHPIPENDTWWGPGFTEWTNVRKARPLFPGHIQPRLPGELGYYDLRDPTVRAAQAQLASNHGIEGFCYWHYWFGGRRLLEQPFNAVLESGEPCLPFCLGWANESWTGVWHGSPKKVLMAQTYPGRDDDQRHFEFLERAFHDPRYIRMDGKPVLVIYKPLNMPDAHGRFDLWRRLAEASGLAGLHLVGFNMDEFSDAASLGLDASLIYRLGGTLAAPRWRRWERAVWGLRRRSSLGSLRRLPYERAVARHLPDTGSAGTLQYPCVVPNFDNSPRSGRRALVLTYATPERFAGHLRAAIGHVQERPWQDRLVFLKSWNEWAEGNYVEPDAEFGRAYLEVIREANLLDGSRPAP